MADVITSHFRLKSHQHSESRTLPTIPPRALKEARRPRRPRPHPARARARAHPPYATPARPRETLSAPARGSRARRCPGKRTAGGRGERDTPLGRQGGEPQ